MERSTGRNRKEKAAAVTGGTRMWKRVLAALLAMCLTLAGLADSGLTLVWMS